MTQPNVTQPNITHLTQTNQN